MADKENYQSLRTCELVENTRHEEKT